MAVVLKDHPDWQQAAQALIDSIAVLDSRLERIELLEHVCEGLGPALYPAFLKILHQLESNSTLEARQLIAETLIECLLSGRLPSGEAGAWGSLGITNASEFVRVRLLGPLEYLCAWQTQGSANQALSAEQFQETLTSLLRLISTNQRAAQLYAEKLKAESADSIGGSFSRTTCEGFLALADAWLAGHPESLIVDQFLEASKPSSLLDRVAKSASDYL